MDTLFWIIAGAGICVVIWAMAVDRVIDTYRSFIDLRERWEDQTNSTMHRPDAYVAPSPRARRSKPSHSDLA